MTAILIQILYVNQVCQNHHQRTVKTLQNHQMTQVSNDFLKWEVTFQKEAECTCPQLQGQVIGIYRCQISIQ